VRRRSIAAVAVFSGAAVGLGLVGNIAAARVDVSPRLAPWLWVGVAVLGLVVVVGAVHELRRADNISTAETSVDRDLSGIADRLAISVQRQWDAEAAWRQLNDPYPMQVRWGAADADLFADWPAVVRLATAGVGWPSPPIATWAADANGLAGCDRGLVDVLGRVPTGRLVLLGEPGAGKTILLVGLTLDLLSRRCPGQAVPILLSLASWNPAEQDLYSWIEHRLVTDNVALAAPALAGSGVSKALALLEARLILLVLDGLDEIPDVARGSAIARINDAMRPGQRLVLAARTEEYRAAVCPRRGVEVQLTGAAGIALCPLDAGVVASYLKASAGGPSAAGRWDQVLSTFNTYHPLPVAQALTTPLMTALARAIYNPRPDEDLDDVEHHPSELLDPRLFPTREAIEQHLFGRFVPAAYRPHPDLVRRSKWTADKAERWLVFLARDLEHRLHGTTDIAWWDLRGATPRSLAGLVVGFLAALVPLGAPVVRSGSGFGFVSALLVGLAVRRWVQFGGGGLMKGLVGGVLGGLTGALVPLAMFGPGVGADRLGSFVGGGIAVGIVVAPLSRFVAGLAGGFVGEVVLGIYDHAALFRGIRATLGLPGLHVVNGIGFGLAAGLAAGLAGRSVPARALRWSPLGFGCGLATGLITGLAVWMQVGPVGGLTVGLAVAVTAGCAGGFLFEMAEVDLTKAAAPRTVLIRDRTTFYRTFLGLGLTIGLGAGTALGLSTSYGHINGVRVGLGVGFTNLVAAGLALAFIQASWGSFTLARWWLAASRRLPWRFMAFLADAHTHRAVLRQVGAVYQFRHAELQRYLAGDRQRRL
jgi:hypothetical protein